MSKEQNTVKAAVTMPVSVTYNGDIKKSDDVAVRRNGFRPASGGSAEADNPNRLTPSLLLATLFHICAACDGRT